MTAPDQCCTHVKIPLARAPSTRDPRPRYWPLFRSHWSFSNNPIDTRAEGCKEFSVRPISSSSQTPTEHTVATGGNIMPIRPFLAGRAFGRRRSLKWQSPLSERARLGHSRGSKFHFGDRESCRDTSPALPLFAGGLGMVGLVARRRKRKAA